MKELFIIRHAKSSWAEPMQADFDRPLNERGKKDAPFMAEELRKRNIPIDLLLTSDAKRATATCHCFSNEFPQAKILIEPKLYQASSKNFYEVVQNIDDQYSHVAIFSHNTGLTDFVNDPCNVHVDIVPTCGIYAIKIAIDNWKDFKKGKRAFWFFDYPKNHLIR